MLGMGVVASREVGSAKLDETVGGLAPRTLKMEASSARTTSTAASKRTGVGFCCGRSDLT